MRLMATDEIGLGDQIGRADRLRPETKVRNGDRAGFLRVIHEITLGMVAGVLADDLDRVLVGPDGAVGTQPVKQRPKNARWLDREGRIVIKAQTGDIVADADGEMIFDFARARLSNTALIIAGVNSLEESPYRPPTTLGIVLKPAQPAFRPSCRAVRQSR